MKTKPIVSDEFPIEAFKKNKEWQQQVTNINHDLTKMWHELVKTLPPESIAVFVWFVHHDLSYHSAKLWKHTGPIVETLKKNGLIVMNCDSNKEMN